MNNQTILILGARSDIGRSIAHAFAALGYHLQLAARNAQNLEPDVADLTLRYRVAVSLHEFDVLQTTQFDTFVEDLSPLPDIVVSVIGAMGDQTESQRDINAANIIIRSNFEGPAAILALLANRFEERGSGTIVGISSVAGERGRASNYIYGSAKSGFTAFLSGLRNRLSRSGVHVVTVLPGFVATRMTASMDLPKKITAHPDEVAQSIVLAVQRRKNIIYVRRVWRIIMFIIGLIPEFIFKFLKL